MIDIQKQIEYWRKGAEEDWPVGSHLVNEGKIRHGLFFVHLALEKILKAHVCRKINDLAPRTHNLVRLLELTGLPYEKEDALFLAELNEHNIEGRYPESYKGLPSGAQVEQTLKTSKRIYEWLRKQLSNQ